VKVAFATIAFQALRPLANVFYAIIKLLRPPKHKITFISRQSAAATVDFTLLKSELSIQDRSLKIKMICSADAALTGRPARKARQTIVELWHIANSSAVVLDSYTPAVSYFSQRKDLYVLQMWHSLGEIEHFEWQCADTVAGVDVRLARALRMHANYSEILVAGAPMREVFRHAFRTSRSRIQILPLPRIDVLRSPDTNRIDMLMSEHRKYFASSPVILYVPAVRKTTVQQKDWADNFAQLLEAVESIKATLIIKADHWESDIQHLIPDSSHLIFNPIVDLLDLLVMADHVITDYHGVAFEAAVARKPLWLFVPDYVEHYSTVGLNIDLRQQFLQTSFATATQLVSQLHQSVLPSDEQEHFLKQYVYFPQTVSVTAAKQIARSILQGIQ